MKRWIHASTMPDDICSKIEKLLSENEIPYVDVYYMDDDPESNAVREFYRIDAACRSC